MIAAITSIVALCVSVVATPTLAVFIMNNPASAGLLHFMAIYVSGILTYASVRYLVALAFEAGQP